ncbi:hypothetical protein DERP_000251 [Dermatophagoides pteronyssinus]|uniref:Uncharacterized protein n=1 Tax=Dermatophagoides pteronyssinus TaxID=6956 RepID=A0ABQ8IZM2_DERPT|nr:hypothetical protein DERP_000251 [Dermatophagoides pteronyssinus]
MIKNIHQALSPFYFNILNFLLFHGETEMAMLCYYKIQDSCVREKNDYETLSEKYLSICHDEFS